MAAAAPADETTAARSEATPEGKSMVDTVCW